MRARPRCRSSPRASTDSRLRAVSSAWIFVRRDLVVILTIFQPCRRFLHNRRPCQKFESVERRPRSNTVGWASPDAADRSSRTLIDHRKSTVCSVAGTLQVDSGIGKQPLIYSHMFLLRR